MTSSYQLTTTPNDVERKPKGRKTSRKKFLPPTVGKYVLGGLLDTPSALRMVGMIKNLPLNLVDVSGKDQKKKDKTPCLFEFEYEYEYGGEELEPNRKKCNEKKRKKKLSRERRAPRTSIEVTVPSLDSEEASTEMIETTTVRNRKRNPRPKLKTSTPATVELKGTTQSCCKPYKGSGEEMSDSTMKRETARLNLDVLKRLANMLGEEREKYAAEREMLGASRDMMVAETRRVNSERSKIESERQKVDLERDMLQSQILGRRV